MAQRTPLTNSRFVTEEGFQRLIEQWQHHEDESIQNCLHLMRQARSKPERERHAEGFRALLEGLNLESPFPRSNNSSYVRNVTDAASGLGVDEHRIPNRATQEELERASSDILARDLFGQNDDEKNEEKSDNDDENGENGRDRNFSLAKESGK